MPTTKLGKADTPCRRSPFNRAAIYLGFMAFSVGWIPVLFLAAASFYMQYDVEITGTSHLHSFPYAHFGKQVGTFGTAWCMVAMTTNAALLCRLVLNRR